MNDLQIFRNHDFGTVRTYIEPNGKILFCGSDVAKALSYTNPTKAINDHCKGISDRRANDSLGRQQIMKFIPEGDLYRLAAKSDLPGAEKFESWIFDEVIPQIRQAGSYSLEPKLPTDFISALESLVTSEKEKLQLTAQIEQDKPYVAFGKAVEVTTNAVKLEMFAKAVQNTYKGLGRNNLFKLLRERHILYYCNGENLPLQEYITRGYFVVKEDHYTRNGESHIGSTTLITGKGQIFLAKKLEEWMDKQLSIA